LRIDRKAPTCELTYDPTGKTNQDVQATLTNCSEPIIVTNNSGNNTYTFTENGTYEFEFTDLLGNTGSITAEVTRIDKDPVTCTITYDPTGKTNQDVTATLTGCNKEITITNNS